MSEETETDEELNTYEEVRKLEGHIQYVNQLIKDLGIDEGDDAEDLAEKGISATDIRAAKRYTKVMNAIANDVSDSNNDDDDDDDDGGSGFRVDDTLR